MEKKKCFLTPEQATKLLGKRKEIHTFRSGGRMLIGADWTRKELITAFDKYRDQIEIGGDQCKAMGHGLVVWTGNEPLFIEVDKDELFELEKSLLSVTEL